MARIWKTPLGERVLHDEEAHLFRQVAASLVDWIEQGECIEEPWETGVVLFDDISDAQRLAMLEAVLLSLTHEDIPAPRRAAILDATVGAVFEHLCDEIQEEIEEDR